MNEAEAIAMVRKLYADGFPTVDVEVKHEYSERHENGPLEPPVIRIAGRKIIIHGHGPPTGDYVKTPR